MSSKSSGQILNISIDLQGYVFNNPNLIAFSYKNKINEIPQGEFIIVDFNSNSLVKESGNFGNILFKDVSTSSDSVICILPFIVDDMIKLNTTNANTTYKIKWSAGTQKALVSQTRAVKGTSVDAILNDADYFGYTMTNKMEENNYAAPADTMIWRYISDTMWDAFDRTITYSYMSNDYLFWAYDDVANKLKLSSLNYEDSLANSNLFIYSTNAKSTSDNVRVTLTNPAITLWAYGDAVPENNLGQCKDKLFPNIIFNTVDAGEVVQGNCGGKCFSKILSSSGDTSHDNIVENTGLTDETATYGPLKVVRNYPNNTHKMYSISKTLREYKYSTYAKILYVHIYNTMGPEIGSKISLVAYNENSKLNGTTIDKKFTDRYFVAGKSIKFMSVSPNAKADLTSTNSGEVDVMLTLISNHLNDEGFDDVKSLLTTVKL